MLGCAAPLPKVTYKKIPSCRTVLEACPSMNAILAFCRLRATSPMPHAAAAPPSSDTNCNESSTWGRAAPAPCTVVSPCRFRNVDQRIFPNIGGREGDPRCGVEPNRLRLLRRASCLFLQLPVLHGYVCTRRSSSSTRSSSGSSSSSSVIHISRAEQSGVLDRCGDEDGP